MSDSACQLPARPCPSVQCTRCHGTGVEPGTLYANPPTRLCESCAGDGWKNRFQGPHEYDRWKRMIIGKTFPRP